MCANRRRVDRTVCAKNTMAVPFVHVLKITLAVRQSVGQNALLILNVSSIKHVSIINVSTHVHRRFVAITHAVRLSITIPSVVVHWALRVIHLFVVYPKKVSLCTLHTFALGLSALNQSISFCCKAHIFSVAVSCLCVCTQIDILNEIQS